MVNQQEGFRAYVRLLRSLQDAGAFGKVAIYPAIGLDCFVAQYCRLIGFNLWSYDIHRIIKELSEAIPDEMVANFRSGIAENLTYMSGVDITRFDILDRQLQPYKHVSPKSLIFKGFFESVFCREWDSDSERYYPLPQEQALARSRKWVAAALSYFSTGDKVVVFDQLMMSAVRAQTRLKALELQLPSLESAPTTIYRDDVPVIYLSRGVALFEYA